MNFGKIFRTIGPIVAMAAAVGLSACQNAEFKINGEEGVPLSELDMTGAAPTNLTLLGPDRIVLTEGSALAISVEGENADKLRFVLDDGSLAVMRDGNSWSGSAATVNVTMPAPEEVVLAGSGKIVAAKLADRADVSIAGSGSLEVANVAGESLEVVVAGSGNLVVEGGSVDKLDLSIAGSGNARMADLMVGTADINIAGSGDAVFSSDGEVDVSIMGSGDVTVRGSARCTVSSMGSGTVTCENVAEAETAS